MPEHNPEGRVTITRVGKTSYTVKCSGPPEVYLTFRGTAQPIPEMIRAEYREYLRREERHTDA